MYPITKFLRKYRWLLLLVIVVAGVFFLGKKLLSNSKQSSVKQEILTAQVQKGGITSSISVSGQVATANYLSVTTSVNGIVKTVFIKEGDSIKSGQKLMEITLDSEGEKSRISSYNNYLKAKNSLEAAEKSLKSLEAGVIEKEATFNDVKEQNNYTNRDERVEFAVSEANYITAKNALNNKIADIEQLRLSVNSAWLDYQTQSPVITAPSDGIIASVLAIEGSKIENSVTSDRSVQIVAAIKKAGTPIASLNIGETDVNKIKVGQKVLLSINSLGDRKLTGAIAGIDKVGANSNGVTNYPVTVKFDQESDQVLPNMNVQAEIVIDEKQAVLFVPSAAIKTRRGKSYVELSKDGKIQEVEIKTGITSSNNTEVVSGLNEGDEVLVEALPTTGFTNNQNQPATNRGNFGGFGGTEVFRQR